MRLSKPVFWLITLLWVAASLWWYAGFSKCSVCTDPALPGASTFSFPGFTVTDSNWNLSTVNNFRFGKSDNIPFLNTGMTNLLDSLGLYVQTHTGKTITVTGYYKQDEKNSSRFADLGLARADEIKKILVSKGIPAAAITTQSEIQEGLVFFPADTLIGGILLAINNVPVPAGNEKDLFQPRTVYFNTGENTLPADSSFTSYIENAIVFLQTNADKKLLVTGFTDNVGDPEKNMRLSAARAAFVKAKLVKKGIPDNRIESNGKGMNDPVADNNTADGRSKNRRVTIQLQ